MVSKINIRIKMLQIWKLFLLPLIELIIIIEAYQFFGVYGLLGLLFAVALIIFIRGWKYRFVFLDSLRQMETVMFGKALDRKNWKKKELKNLKVKVKWRKKDGTAEKKKDNGTPKTAS